MPRSRKNNTKNLNPNLKIFCEGSKTEPAYLRGYLDHFAPPNVANVKLVNCGKNTPVQLVDAAIKDKDTSPNLPKNQYWVVYDREANSKYDRKLHLQAWKKAKENEIHIVINNVCFEIWLLMHFEFSTREYTCFSDLYKNSNLSQLVKENCGCSYDKAMKQVFEGLKSRIGTARQNANKINQLGLDAAERDGFPFDVNPYTNMPDLLDSIDKF